MKFLANESVTIALLFSSIALYFATTSPSVLANTLVVVGLVAAWMAILVMNVNRL